MTTTRVEVSGVGKKPLTTQDVLRRSLRRLMIATAVLYFMLVAGGLKVYLDSRNTTQTLCSLRQDLEVRVAGSIKFLQENPNGIPGVPVKTIAEQIANQQRTIDALKNLDCDTTIPEAALNKEPQ